MSAGVLGILPAALFAQEQAIVEIPNAGATIVGEVNASSVNVRSGPAESYYPTTMLNKGDRVLAVGHQFDWLKIVPPKGSFSYIAKIYVDRQGATSTGKVNRDDVLVRAGSTLNAISATKAQPQMKLNSGAAVEIIGEADEYYKIAPPEGAYLYVAKRFVEPTTENVTALAPTTAASVTASGIATTQPTAEPKIELTPSRPAVVSNIPKTDPVAEEREADFRKLEIRFNQLKEQPVEQQPVAELLAGYRELLASENLSPSAKRASEGRIKYLELAQTQQDDLKKAREEEASFTGRQAQIDRERDEIQRRLNEKAVAVYTALGQLQSSTIQKDGQPLLRLVDPADGRTLVYLHVTDTNQRAMVGQFIGVRGEPVIDPVLSLNIIEPTEVQPVDQSRVMHGVTAKIYPPSIVRNASGSEK